MKNSNKYILNPDTPYFKSLKLISKSGHPTKNLADKYHQVQMAIIYLDQIIKKTELPQKNRISVVDMGAGKGYLTFAVYDYLNKTLGVEAEVTGIEIQQKLVDKSNALAQELGYQGLKFEASEIENYKLAEADISIALHACNTATDHAIAKGIKANAQVIIVVPCCHEEIFDQIQGPDLLQSMLKHSKFRDTLSQMLTDTMRALILEQHGYDVTIFEFVGDSHTPRNHMIRAVRKSQENQDKAKESAKKLAQLQNEFNIDQFTLKEIL